MSVDLGADLTTVLDGHVQRRPDDTFLVLPREGIGLTFGEFDLLCDRIAGGLSTLGVGRGSFVAQLVTPSKHFLSISYAIKRIGAVEVPVSEAFRGDSLTTILRLTGASVIAVSGDAVGALAAVARDLVDLRALVLVDCDSQQAALMSEAFPSAELVLLDDLLSYESRVARPRAHPTDLQAIGFTSGTTGLPKACLLSHRYALACAASVIERCDLTANDGVYTMWPLHHVAAAYYDVLSMLVVGGRVISVPEYDPNLFWEDLRRSKATWFEGMGSLLQTLNQAPARTGDRDHSVRFVWGAQFSFDVDAFEHRYGWRVLRGGGYSSTDGGSIAMPALTDDPPPHCAGQTFDTHEVRIFDEFDNEQRTGHEGEIVVRPRIPGVMSAGYLGMPDQTMSTQRNLWFHTGDAGMLDESGRLYYYGRTTERFSRGGRSVNTHEISDVFEQHPAVSSCVAVPVQSGAVDPMLHLYVETRPDRTTMASDLRLWAAELLPAALLPDEVHVFESLPRTPTGKIAVARLRELVPPTCSPGTH